MRYSVNLQNDNGLKEAHLKQKISSLFCPISNRFGVMADRSKVRHVDDKSEKKL